MGRFYTECFGMKVLRKRDVPEEKYSNAFLGFGPEESHFVVELTYSKFKASVCMLPMVLGLFKSVIGFVLDPSKVVHLWRI